MKNLRITFLIFASVALGYLALQLVYNLPDWVYWAILLIGFIAAMKIIFYPSKKRIIKNNVPNGLIILLILSIFLLSSCAGLKSFDNCKSEPRRGAAKTEKLRASGKFINPLYYPNKKSSGLY